MIFYLSYIISWHLFQKGLGVSFCSCFSLALLPGQSVSSITGPFLPLRKLHESIFISPFHTKLQIFYKHTITEKTIYINNGFISNKHIYIFVSLIAGYNIINKWQYSYRQYTTTIRRGSPVGSRPSPMELNNMFLVKTWFW